MIIQKELAVSALAVSVIFFMAYRQVFPFGEIMNWGARFKASQAKEVLAQDYELYATQSLNEPNILLDIKSGIHFWHPQVVVWIEDTTGRYIKTLFITESTAKGLFMSGRTVANFKSFDNRKTTAPISSNDLRLVDALPYWSHKRDKETLPGFYAPTFDQPEVDGMTGATPESNFYIRSQIPDTLTSFNIWLEVNVAFDDNEYYSEYDFPDDSLYHGGTGLLGQPSLIYRTTVDTGNKGQFTLMQLMGHSHHSGQTGLLYTDLSAITTARQIIDRIVVNMTAQ